LVTDERRGEEERGGEKISSLAFRVLRGDEKLTPGVGEELALKREVYFANT
jgi:hypothetical protein